MLRRFGPASGAADPLRRKRERGCDGEKASHGIGQALKGCRKERHREKKRGEDAKHQQQESFPSWAKRWRLVLFGGASLDAGAGLVWLLRFWKRKVRELLEGFDGDDPAAVEQMVAMNAVPMMEVGLAAPAAERIPTVVAGMSWIELVLIARNVHMALVATPGRGFSVSRSCMARRPKRSRGVRQTQHVGGHVHHHRTHRGMPGRNIRKQPAHDRPERRGEKADQT